jgi:hypothetical protein
LSSILPSYLRLLSRVRDLPVPTVADAVLFAAGEKRALRFAVPAPSAEAVRCWADAEGLAVASELMVARPVAEGWNVVEPLDASAPPPPPETLSEVVIVARDRALAEELCGCEVSGSPARAGELLDYPSCCIEAYASHSRHPGGWIAAALAPCEGAPPLCWCNRLPLVWQAPTFIGEVYPCSFRCPRLAARGKRVYELLGSFGLEALARHTLEQTLRPVVFRPDRPHPSGSAYVSVDRDATGLPDYLECST